MRTDYFDDLLPDSVTHVTQPKTERVTPETDKATSKNSDLAEASRMSRTSRTKTGNTEQITRRTLRAFRYRLRECPGSSLILIAPGESLDEATEGLRRKYGDRLIDVKAYERQPLAADSENE